MSTLLSFEMTGGSCLSLGPTGLWGTFNRVNLVCKSMERLMVVRHLNIFFYFSHWEHCKVDWWLNVLGMMVSIKKCVDVGLFCD